MANFKDLQSKKKIVSGKMLPQPINPIAPPFRSSPNPGLLPTMQQPNQKLQLGQQPFQSPVRPIDPGMMASNSIGKILVPSPVKSGGLPPVASNGVNFATLHPTVQQTLLNHPVVQQAMQSVLGQSSGQAPAQPLPK